MTITQAASSVRVLTLLEFTVCRRLLLKKKTGFMLGILGKQIQPSLTLLDFL